MSTYHIRTFGCQMNEYDSHKMGALLRSRGYEPALSEDVADVIVINTCSVRDKSYQKALSAIGRMRKSQKKKAFPSTIAVAGCVVSHEGEAIRKRFPFIDILLGPDHVGELPDLVAKARKNGSPVTALDFKDLSDYEFPEILTSLPSAHSSSDRRPVKAYVTVMKGCDNVCSFCIVPFVRGGEVSRPVDDVIREILALEKEGVREVTLLGQNVNSYGKALSVSFVELLRRVDRETHVDRVRFTSPHPKDLSPELIEEYRTNTKLCPHMHLPVQSGSNRILKAMRRAYTREVFLKKVDRLKQVRPDVAITTDIIVGFPGETEKDFDATLSLVREAEFDASYSFAFSPRPLTEAARLVDDVPRDVKMERLYRLKDLQSEIGLRRNQTRLGVVEPVLVESSSRSADSSDGGGALYQLMGRTPHGRVVHFNSDRDRTGDILDVAIQEATITSLKGTLCK